MKKAYRDKVAARLARATEMFGDVEQNRKLVRRMLGVSEGARVGEVNQAAEDLHYLLTKDVPALLEAIEQPCPREHVRRAPAEAFETDNEE